MSRIEEGGRKWLGRAKLCINSGRAVLRRRDARNYILVS